MTNYERGVAFEREVAEHYRNKGAVVVRAAGSHSPFDLVVLHPYEMPIVIQCKRYSKYKAYPDNEYKNLRVNGAIKIWASKKKGERKFELEVVS